MSKITDMFTPKRIIFDAIKDKITGTGIIKAVLVFNIQTDVYNVMFSQADLKSIKLDIEDQEIKLLKRFFINKIISEYKKESDKEIKCVILQISFVNEELKIFIEDEKGNVELFKTINF
jgi:hypothetical protein